MLKILAIGDPHFKVNNPRETEEMSQKIVEYAEKGNFDAIVVLGDTLDRHEAIHVKPLQRAIDMLLKLSKIAPLFLLIGNHDRPNNSNYLTNEHPFNALKPWPNTLIVDQGAIVTLKGYRLMMVPYVPPGRFDEAISEILAREFVREKEQASNDTTKQEKETGDTEKSLDLELQKFSGIFAHQEFQGAKMQSGRIQSKVGDYWALTRPFIVSGHIHDYDRLQENIVYTGTPIQHAFDESDNKSVSVYTWATPGTRPVEERVDLHLKKKIEVHLRWDEIATYSPPANRLVKIILIGTAAELKSAMETANYKALLNSGVKIVTKFIPEKNPLVAATSRECRRISYIEKLMQTVYEVKNPEFIEIWNDIFSAADLQNS